MSVIVKGMEMPKDCNDCPCFEREWFNDDIVGFCKAIKLRIETYERLLNCPLVEIPIPHGRMIDIDDAIKSYGERAELGYVSQSKFLNVVIQAEGSEE